MSDRTLNRTLSLPLVVAYGLGTILGAGIYVLIGAVAAKAGSFMPWSFLLAGLVAAFSAFSYAGLGSRYPQAAGEAVYLDRAFSRDGLTKLVGFAVVSVGIVSSATIATGFAGYLQIFVAIPSLPASLLLVCALGLLAIIGIKESVWMATTITIIEIGGLLLIVVIAAPAVPKVFESDIALFPGLDWHSWAAVSSGAFLAFYAFIGFEDMVNVAEEIRDPQRNLPQAIIWALVLSTLLYTVLAVTIVAAMSIEDLSKSSAPLAQLAESRGIDPRIMGFIGMLAVINGALIQIIMGSRVLFGMGKQAWLPQWFAQISPRTRTPVNATLVVTAVICLFVWAFPLVKLAAITSFITLLIFAAINVALWSIQRRVKATEQEFKVPQWVPLGGAVLCLLLAGFELVANLGG